MSGGVLTWWALLCTVSAANVLAWLAAAALLRRRQAQFTHDELALRRALLLLSAGYVLGCAYRSVFPVFDVQRLVVVDSWLSSILIGRTVATLAELCFAAQWALLLRSLAQQTDQRFGLRVAYLLVPVIALAELCSWLAVLTTANLGHVVEETVWGLCAALLVTSLALMWPHCTRRSRVLLATLCPAGAAYVGFMFAVDVPMYWSRWVADETAGRPYLSVAEGLVDAATRRVVSHQWDDWKTEVAWMSLYFSTAVWLSIALVHVPLLQRSSRPGAGRSRATARIQPSGGIS